MSNSSLNSLNGDDFMTTRPSNDACSCFLYIRGFPKWLKKFSQYWRSTWSIHNCKTTRTFLLPFTIRLITWSRTGELPVLGIPGHYTLRPETIKKSLFSNFCLTGNWTWDLLIERLQTVGSPRLCMWSDILEQFHLPGWQETCIER